MNKNYKVLSKYCSCLGRGS